jgi:hypothetical protein
MCIALPLVPSDAPYQHTLMHSARRAPATAGVQRWRSCSAVSAKGARHHPSVLLRREFLTAQRSVLAPRDPCTRCQLPPPDADTDARSSDRVADAVLEADRAGRARGGVEKTQGTCFVKYMP